MIVYLLLEGEEFKYETNVGRGTVMHVIIFFIQLCDLRYC